MDYSRPELPSDHPIAQYYRENDEMRKLLLAVEDLVQYPMIKNQWLELYEKISQYPTHFKRKQNQLYPVLEQKGFTRSYNGDVDLRRFCERYHQRIGTFARRR